MMVVATSSVIISTEDCFSLKEKRGIIKSIKQKLRNNFNISVAEVDALGNISEGEIGIAFICNDKVYADKTISSIINFIEKIQPGRLIDYDLDIYHR